MQEEKTPNESLYDIIVKQMREIIYRIGIGGSTGIVVGTPHLEGGEGYPPQIVQSLTFRRIAPNEVAFPLDLAPEDVRQQVKRAFDNLFPQSQLIPDNL